MAISACSSELSDDDPEAPASSPAPPPQLPELCSPRRRRRRHRHRLPLPLRPSSAAAAELRPPPSRSVIDSFRSWRPGHRAPPFPSSSSCSFGCLSSAIGLHGFLHSGDSALRASLQRRGFHARTFFSLPQNLGNTLMLTPDGIVYGLIGANVAVFVLWRIADTDFMRDNFMIAKMFGAEFLLTDSAGALGGSIFFLVYRAILGHSSEGASAAVYSIYFLDIFLSPESVIVPLLSLGAIAIGTDLRRVMKGNKRVSGEAHLGGVVVAALVAARIKGWI